MRFHGVNNDGETMSSFYVDHDPETYGTDAGGPSLARQEFADECDINILMASYEKTGVLNHYNNNPPQYLDVSDIPDLATAIQIVDHAKTAFMTLNAETRRQFDNDPVKFVAFAENPANIDKMREWKLAPPAPVEPVKEPDRAP
ncbi:MAG: internal scaffolding protein [Microvirus sp.]|nr:MAG: internal scaffolding protein [Microvirus sp.]